MKVRTKPDFQLDLKEVTEVKILGGQIKMSDIIETMPVNGSLSVMSYANCTNKGRLWKESKTVQTTEKLELFFERELTSTNISNVDVTIDWGALKIGGGLKNEAVQKLKETRRYESEVKTNEVIEVNEEVDPMTALFMKAMIKKGFIRAKLSGYVILDAFVKVRNANDLVRTETWLSDGRYFTQMPSDKTVPYNGFVTSETYSHVEKAIGTEQLTSADPRCQSGVSVQISQIVEVTTERNIPIS